MFTLKNISVRVGSAIAVLALTACGSISNVSDKGTTDEPVWPDSSDVSFNTGSYPEIDNLRLIDAGMTKDQLYNLLGRPHFAEGLFGVHEWDYLFHFRTANGDVTCQYKVLFDKDMLAQSFFWKDPACADLVNGQQKAETYSLASDVLFGFDSAVLTSKGRSAVAEVASKISGKNDATVTVVGHTDNIGAADYNMNLSQQRAGAIRSALISNGVTANSINTLGKGETEPVVNCDNNSKADLISCLAPNRRVEIVVSAKQ